MREPASFVLLETALGPSPQSSAWPTTGRPRMCSNSVGRLVSSAMCPFSPACVISRLHRRGVALALLGLPVLCVEGLWLAVAAVAMIAVMPPQLPNLSHTAPAGFAIL